MTATKLTPAARKARTVRRAAGTAFYIGAAVSVAANVYASNHTPIGVAVGVWTPAAALLALELVERVPARGRAGVARKLAVAFIALVAAYGSYRHLVTVCHDAGADPISTYLMPLTVDGMMALARVAMSHRPTTPARRKPATAKKVSEKSLRIVRSA